MAPPESADGYIAETSPKEGHVIFFLCDVSYTVDMCFVLVKFQCVRSDCFTCPSLSLSLSRSTTKTQSRRAVTFLDTFAVIFYVVCIAFYGWQSVADYEGDFNGVDSITDAHWIVMAFLFVGLLCAALGLMGAKRFNSCFAGTAAVWYGLSFLLNFFTVNIPNAILMFVLAYPHIVFYYEVKEGIMTDEKYPNEVYSICCV